MSGFWNMNVPRWKRALLTRLVALIPGIIVALTATSQFDALDQGLNVLQSVALPFALVPLLKVAGSPEIMGPYTNSYAMSAFGWLVAIASVAVNIYTVVDAAIGAAEARWWVWLLLAAAFAAYAAVLAWMVWQEVGGHAGDYQADLTVAGPDADDDDISSTNVVRTVDMSPPDEAAVPAMALPDVFHSANRAREKPGSAPAPSEPGVAAVLASSQRDNTGSCETAITPGVSDAAAAGLLRVTPWWVDADSYLVPIGQCDTSAGIARRSRLQTARRGSLDSDHSDHLRQGLLPPGGSQHHAHGSAC